MARTGMTTLIDTVRGMTDAGSADYQVGTISFWADDEVQRVMDRHRTEVIRSQMTPVETYNAGTVEFKQYFGSYGNLEQTTGGTAIFYLESAAGSVIGTALYTPDYAAGKVTFAADTTGSTVYLYGYSYDLNATAADMWRMKAANASKQFDFSTDNMSVKRSQFQSMCFDMAKFYEGQAAPVVIQLYREDNYPAGSEGYRGTD